MIAALIRWSVRNRFLVLVATLFLVAAGLIAMSRMTIDAIPDLSDTQVIVRTPYPGKAPQVVEDLVTYPLTTTMLSVPGARTVRGYSFFGDSFIYILFDDKTDPYWARSRVVVVSPYLTFPFVEALAEARANGCEVQLITPCSMVPRSGPDTAQPITSDPTITALLIGTDSNKRSNGSTSA